jgi:hypothetical protein
MKPALIKRPKTFSFEIRQADSFRHSIELTKSFGSLDYILDWAKAELRDEWRWQVIRTSSDRDPGRYTFYFDSESDYLAFVMKFA